jgi:hypothetical protein
MNRTLTAYFDGERILFDEPVELVPNTKLLVTVLSGAAENEAWLQLSAKRLQTAYDNGEEEYPSDLIKEPNPEYESR